MNEAPPWLEKAAERGNALAKCQLGKPLLLGAEAVPRDMEQALELLTEYAKAGNQFAQHTLDKAGTILRIRGRRCDPDRQPCPCRTCGPHRASSSFGVKWTNSTAEMTLAVMSQKGSAAKAAAAVNNTGNSKMPARNRLLRTKEQSRASPTCPRAVDISTTVH